MEAKKKNERINRKMTKIKTKTKMSLYTTTALFTTNKRHNNKIDKSDII